MCFFFSIILLLLKTACFYSQKLAALLLGQTTMRIILVDCVAFMNIFRMPAPHRPLAGHTKGSRWQAGCVHTYSIYTCAYILYSVYILAICMLCVLSLSVCTKSVSLKLVISSILFSHFPFPCDDQLHTSYSTRNMQHVTALVVIVLVLLLLLLLFLYAMLLSSNTKCPLNVSDHTWLLLCLCVSVCLVHNWLEKH